MDQEETSYTDLVGAAYDVSAEPERFDDLLDVAAAYFFSQSTSTPGSNPLDGASLESRSRQIARLLEHDFGRPEPSSPQPFHARLEVDIDTLRVRGNPAAAELTQCRFPCKIDDLPFDHDTRRIVRQNIVAPSSEDPTSDQVILTIVDSPTVRSCLALVQRPRDGSCKIILSISYIDWSDDLISRLGKAFGLTPSEQAVLGGCLRGQTRKAIAGDRGTTEETVKAQIKAILKKTNAARMSDVVQLSASIAYLLREHPDAKSDGLLDAWETPIEHLQTLSRPGGRTLAYYKYGTGQRVVLFVHGFIQGPFFPAEFLAGVARNDVTLYCPSRPSFGFTSASTSRADHNQCVIDDALALVAKERLSDITLVTHQGGVSHAFRIAGQLGENVRAVVMIDAGVPIDEDKHLSQMDHMTRLAGAATKHAPSVMAMMMNLGIPIYKKRGIKAFLQNYLKDSPLDLKSLDDPETLALCASGCFHNVQQGSEAWVRDGAAAMANWQSDFDRVSCPQVWMHPDSCPIMRLEFVTEFVSQKLGQSVDVVRETGLNVLFQRPTRVLDVILKAAQS